MTKAEFLVNHKAINKKRKKSKSCRRGLKLQSERTVIVCGVSRNLHVTFFSLSLSRLRSMIFKRENERKTTKIFRRYVTSVSVSDFWCR